MNHVKCPHCGFRNFAISAYCGRCERPLRQRTAALHDPPLGPEVAATTDAHRVVEELELEPVDDPVDLQESRPPLFRPPLAAVPPPAPPPLAPVEPSPLPISLPDARAHKAARKAAKKAKRARRNTAPVDLAAFELALPGVVRLLPALVIDLALLVGVMVGYAWLEVSLFSDAPAPAGRGMDALASWMSLNGPAVQHALGLGTALGLVHAAVGAYYGQTLGRRLTGLMLIRASGRPVGWPLAALRAVLAFISVVTFGFGFFFAITDAKMRTLHDRLFRMVVVRRKLKV